MKSVTAILTDAVASAFEACGYEKDYGLVSFSKTDFCQFQCNGSFSAAKKYKTNPLTIAEQVKEHLEKSSSFFTSDVARPGFININLTDEYLALSASQILQEKKTVLPSSGHPSRIVIDYGGPNVAKPLHVGHLRSAIIGESIKRIGRLIGHEIIGDVHLGDWGLQMGMIIAYLKRRQPELPFFSPQPQYEGKTEAPFDIDDLERIYPEASALAKQDPTFLNEARLATFELQRGNHNYRLLWKHIVDVSIADLKLNYQKLGVTFDVWKGESDSQPYIPEMVAGLQAQGYTRESEGALVVEIAEPTDKTEMPPLILYKSDGAALYSTTDLATIVQRRIDYRPDYILYVVDKRQATHFKQVFRAAYKTGIVSADTILEHVAFGTMNGKDGKPFRTRQGGVMKLSTLTEILIEEAKKRLESVNTSNITREEEKQQVAELVGLSALKFGDLINSRESDYVFDIEKFCSFEGKTGPYLLYSVVRIKSILAKAAGSGLSWSDISGIRTGIERNLLIKVLEFQDTLQQAFDRRLPSIIAEYVYSLSNIYNSFYHENHVMNEPDPERQSTLLGIVALSLKTMETCLGLLGIDAPERM